LWEVLNPLTNEKVELTLERLGLSMLGTPTLSDSARDLRLWDDSRAANAGWEDMAREFLNDRLERFDNTGGLLAYLITGGAAASPSLLSSATGGSFWSLSKSSASGVGVEGESLYSSAEMCMLLSTPESCPAYAEVDILLNESMSVEMTCTDPEGVSGKEESAANCARSAWAGAWFGRETNVSSKV
jgi:hypothetical protein